MSTITGRELRVFATQQLQRAQHELEDLASTRGRHGAAADQLQRELENAWHTLLEIAIPDLTPARLDQAAHQLALPQLAATEVARRTAERKAQLEATITRINQDPALRAPEEVEARIDIRRKGLDEQFEPLRASVQALEAEAGLAELISSEYGTPEYRGRWWQPSFYRHWKRGDEVLEKHGARFGVQDFGGLRARYLREREAAQTFHEERAGLEAQSAQLQQLVQQRSEAEAGLGALPAWALATIRARLREHLQSLPDEQRLPLFASSPPLALAGKRVAGLEAKLRYFAAIGDEWLMRPRVEVQRRIDKLEHFLAKLAASPRKLDASYDRDEMAAKLALPLDRWQERRQRYLDSSNQIVVFQNYDAYDALRGYLWWDLMTDGQVRGNFIPEVSEYHAHHRDTSDDATAAIASSYDRDRYTSVDAS